MNSGCFTDLVVRDFCASSLELKSAQESAVRIDVTPDSIRIQDEMTAGVSFVVALSHLVDALRPLKLQKTIGDIPGRGLISFRPSEAANTRPLTQAALWPMLASIFKSDDSIFAEVGSCSFGLQNVKLPTASFQSAAVWASIGWSGGAIVGAAFAAQEQGRRAFLCTGDGSYMETIQDLGTLIRFGLTPTIFLVNNSGYTVERHSESSNLLR
jgi:pyruvate decarboxylase